MNNEYREIEAVTLKWKKRQYSRLIAIGIGLLSLWMFALPAHAQKPPKGFTVSYDKFKDETSVSFMDRNYKNGIDLVGWFTHKGASLTEDQSEFLLTFDGPSHCSGYCFKHITRAIFLIDGERIELPEKDVLSDFVTYTIDRELLSRLSQAKLIEYQVGRFEGQWKEKDLARFQTLFDLGTVKRKG